MKNLFILFFLMAQLAVSQSKVTTLYFIRHAEKIDNSQNPDLSEIGKIRAEKWKTIFNTVVFDAIYTTDFNRTKQTAMPIAMSKKTESVVYNPKTIDVVGFLNTNKGKAVLVVGHSNSTPDFVNKIIKENKYLQIEETVFGNLYIVTIYDDLVVSHQLLNCD